MAIVTTILLIKSRFFKSIHQMAFFVSARDEIYGVSLRDETCVTQKSVTQVSDFVLA